MSEERKRLVEAKDKAYAECRRTEAELVKTNAECGKAFVEWKRASADWDKALAALVAFDKQGGGLTGPRPDELGI